MEVQKQNQHNRPGSSDRRGGGRDGGHRRNSRPQQEVKEYEQKILDLARVTRVTAGGKRMSFRASLLIGDKKGRVGLGVAKGADVQLAVEKAYRQAKKRLVRVPLVNGTIPHLIHHKFGAASVLLKPAPVGTGLKCGGAVRVVMELAGVPNVVSKVLGSNNKLNLAYATVEAISLLKTTTRRPEHMENIASPVASEASDVAEKAPAKRVVRARKPVTEATEAKKPRAPRAAKKVSA